MHTPEPVLRADSSIQKAIKTCLYGCVAYGFEAIKGMLNNNIFCNYPDAMTLAQLAECLNISTKLASRLVHEKKVFAKKVGREYRISKNSVVEFVRGKKKHTKKSCVVNVTSNPQDWIIEDKCGILCAAAKRKEVC